MLRNRLAELLSERQLSISKVAKDTGISRNTITATAQNDSKMIQYKTIDDLCQYLKVTPNEFFDYIPIGYSTTHFFNECKVNLLYDEAYMMHSYEMIYNFDFFIDIHKEGKLKTYEFFGELLLSEADPSFSAEDHYYISVNAINENSLDEFKEVFYNQLSAGHQVLFNKEIETELLEKLCYDLRKEYTDVEEFDIEAIIENLNISVLTDWSLPF